MSSHNQSQQFGYSPNPPQILPQGWSHLSADQSRFVSAPGTEMTLDYIDPASRGSVSSAYPRSSTTETPSRRTKKDGFHDRGSSGSKSNSNPKPTPKDTEKRRRRKNAHRQYGQRTDPSSGPSQLVPHAAGITIHGQPIDDISRYLPHQQGSSLLPPDPQADQDERAQPSYTTKDTYSHGAVYNQALGAAIGSWLDDNDPRDAELSLDESSSESLGEDAQHEDDLMKVDE